MLKVFIPSIPQPTTDHAALRFHLLGFHVTINYFPLCFSKKKKNLSCRILNTQSDMQWMLQCGKIRPAFWVLYQREGKMLTEKTFILSLVSIKRKTDFNIPDKKVPIKSRCCSSYDEYMCISPHVRYLCKILDYTWKCVMILKKQTMKLFTMWCYHLNK